MFHHQRISPRHYIIGAAWLLLGLAVGLHFPDIDSRLQWLLPPSVLLHRSILTHGLGASSLLFWLVRGRGDTVPSLRLFVIGWSSALAVHLCFDFFPRGWVGFALIHVPVYGRTTALFSQTWIILSIGVCLYVAFLMVRNIIEFVLSIVNLIISFIVSAVEDSRVALLAFMLLALATVITIVMARQARKATARRA
jgi:hypothetical protein